jgi:hypothetical protein
VKNSAILARIKAAVRDGRYEVTEHAILEAEADGFGPLDLRNALLTGEIRRKLIRDPRGTRYIIVGTALDGRAIYVVCRFTELKEVRVITAYAEDE